MVARYRHPLDVRRTLRGLARVVCPPDIDELGVADAVVDHAELSMRALPAAIRVALVAGVRTFDAGAAVIPRHLGRRFHALERDDAHAYFLAWRRGARIQREFAKGVKGLLCLAYYELPAVQARMGYTPGAWIDHVKRRRLASYAADIERHHRSLLAPDPLPRAPAVANAGADAGAVSGPRTAPGPRTTPAAPALSGVRTRRHARGDTVLGCDVVIVGSGAGGATLAAELAEGGLDVVVVEEGGWRDTREFTHDASAMIRALYRDGGASMALGSPPVLFQEGRTVGGSTVINGGMSWRTPERVLEAWARDHAIPGVRPADMAPYFDRVERRIHVREQDPESIGRDNELLKRGADALGWNVIPNRRNQVHCPGSNNCAFGCPTGAKQSALVSYIPRALQFGARVVPDVRVDRITRAGKRATGVEGRVVGQPDGARGARVIVRAKLVVSACGAIQTPALLARSRVRSPSGQLGRNLSLHPNCKLVAIFDDPVRGWEGVHQAYQVREFQDQGLLFAAVNVPPSILAMTMPQHGAALGELLADYDRMVVAGMLVEDTRLGRVRVGPDGTPRAFYQLSDRDAETMVRGTALLSELLFAAGARRILLPFAGADELLGPDDARRLADACVPKGSIEVLTVHMMGTARMGGDRACAVVDPFGAVYDADRLFVCDASVFPGPIGVNPAETIQALATRTAAHILDNRRRYTS